MRIACPFCGARGVDEFRFRSLAPAAFADGFEATYLRDAAAAPTVEHWQHLRGCRAWLEIVRDPHTGAIEAIGLLEERR